MKYKCVETKNGRVQYWGTDENGKYGMISAKDVPESIFKNLEAGMELEVDVAPVEQKVPDEAPAIRREDRTCFICGEPGPFKKFLQLETVYLCDNHQHSLTTGEVVYEMRKAGIIE